MDYKAVGKKWNKIWQESRLYKFNRQNIANKKYVLEMFSYPSGDKLHVGHWYNYALTDSYARFLRLKGYEVFQPMGFDAFGLPAENYAIKTGIHPKDSTEHNVSVMERQLKEIGAMFDWDYEVVTCREDYYKWTQWLFLQLYKKGLAYRKNAPVNWCPSCNTVLANEQVVDGRCERCESEVCRKNLTQWFFKITDYAEELLDRLPSLDWPEKTKLMQTNWIGKSQGAEITFNVENSKHSFNVFTTRADTLFGCSYCVLAPEHPLVDKITVAAQKEEVENYKLAASKANEIERLNTAKEKTGVFTGAYAINPANGQKVGVWIGDYVLYTYGTGAIMAVPAHDERDFLFAQKHGLEIKQVIKNNGTETPLPFCEYGVLVNSGEFDGIPSKEAITKITQKLEEKGKGKLVTNYRLRDWLVSRQRYWGAPIPIIYCDKCGTVPVPQEQLPVSLPYGVNFTPDGTSPLAKDKGFANTLCPKCGGKAKREVDTLDTFVCSSWYYLRYPDNKNEKEPFDKEWINKMLPVDKYVGGPEHACMHLLYARFITKALRDMGYLSFDEPFTSLVHQGIILGPDGNRMSKSHGNVISPDPYIEQYGSDIFRVYLAFAFKYIEGGPWSDEGIKAISRWLERVERTVKEAYAARENKAQSYGDKELKYWRANTLKQAECDMWTLSYNTAIARMMELTNALNRYFLLGSENINGKLAFDTSCDLLKILSPFAPHIAEELWEYCGMPYSIFNTSYPSCEEKDLTRDKVEYALQINSKIRCRIELDASLSVAEIEKAALDSAAAKEALEGKSVKKVIVIPNRLVNIII